MRISCFSLPSATLALCLALPLGAQGPMPQPPSSDPLALPQASPELSPLLAGVLQALLPPLPLGYVYVSDLRRSLLPTGLMIGGATLFVLETVELVDWTREHKSPALLYVGMGSMMVGYLYGIIDAADAARDRNAGSRGARVALGVGPSPAGRGVQVSISLHRP